MASPITAMNHRALGRSLRVFVVDDRAGRSAPRGLARWLSCNAPRSARGELTVVIVSDRKIRRLNEQFRGVDRATDVLSFPMNGVANNRDPIRNLQVRSSARKTSVELWPSVLGCCYLGDIMIAAGVAVRQARAEGRTFGRELRLLALHGLLHLMGYDHESDTGQMERFERRLRRKAKI